MFADKLPRLLAAGTLTLVLLAPAVALAQDVPPPPPAGLDVLARGPVHEAFAEPLETAPQQSPVIAQEPPRLIEEQPPDQRPEGNVIWIPGYWQWDEDRTDFIWVSGVWRLAPPGRTWVPGSYRVVKGGFQWSPGMWVPDNQGPLSLLPQPPASLENGPPPAAPGANSIYVPGIWIYRDARYAWRPGFYVDYNPNWIWVPACYVWTPAGYLFVEGYWDFPLVRRGLLFSPVAFNAALLNRPGFIYTPSWSVNLSFLPSALFIRPNCGHYYFGDYFKPAYTRIGYTPWVDYRWGRGAYDPLFAHARIAQGPGVWGRQMTTLYADRFAGRVALPPRTLVLQNTLIKNNGRETKINVNLTPLNHLSQVGAQGVKLTTVKEADRQVHLREGLQLRDVGAQRRTLETRVMTEHPTTPTTLAAPHTIKLDLPARRVGAAPVGPEHRPPPHITPPAFRHVPPR